MKQCFFIAVCTVNSVRHREPFMKKEREKYEISFHSENV